tara:strand:+ start:24991 stop:25158 length:168 start_codon:yes stop_codon:yes gene_type:complete
MDKETKERQEIAIRGAISYWTDKKNGVILWWDKSRHTPEQCEKNIKYFKKLRNDS